ncbi:Very-short-patch mismatch repair endonuclease (G-T specific) [Candidatus Hydrogenisulfobacillus filiaventi]|uniref:Very-short-patch mismatch repair endonuclease (G-T specific) n=1 Tax=Candidatus Hydrogenisulfobacillus filiaventi TaxID=2707344 RepID=A0A6F8ZID1_9FIRM|nr:Very-short-patch mismatch repair endonuclease (G-T specific) [Candidatus Hydrogenisulfobacillus filiaventi]
MAARSAGQGGPHRRRARPLSRSEIMARIRSKDTKPEWRVRRALWAMGVRYRLHDPRLPGRPDIVLPRSRQVIFVHGCFWHGHEGCPRHRIPKTNSMWWEQKIRANRARDARVTEAVRAAGWAVTIIWECETESPEALAQALANVARIAFACNPGKGAPDRGASSHPPPDLRPLS